MIPFSIGLGLFYLREDQDKGPIQAFDLSVHLRGIGGDDHIINKVLCAIGVLGI